MQVPLDSRIKILTYFMLAVVVVGASWRGESALGITIFAAMIAMAGADRAWRALQVRRADAQRVPQARVARNRKFDLVRMLTTAGQAVTLLWLVGLVSFSLSLPDWAARLSTETWLPAVVLTPDGPDPPSQALLTTLTPALTPQATVKSTPASTVRPTRLRQPAPAVSATADAVKLDRPKPDSVAKPTPMPSGSSTAAQTVRHVVQPGENPWCLAQKYYADWRQYPAICAFNGLWNEAAHRCLNIRVGSTLAIPQHADLPDHGIPAPLPPPGERYVDYFCSAEDEAHAHH